MSNENIEKLRQILEHYGTMICVGNLGGAYSAGGTNNLQKSAYEAINAKEAEIDSIRAEMQPLQEDIERLREEVRTDKELGIDPERNKRWLAEAEQALKEEFTDRIAELEKDIKKLRKAGREENKGQLTFFSMRKTK